MAFKILYKTLFNVHVLHSYFLNNGEEMFSSMPGDEQKKLLATYNYQEFLNILPTPACKESLRNHGLVYRQQNDRILVLAKVEEQGDDYKTVIRLPEDLQLNFYIYKKDYLFDNYTFLKSRENRFFYFTNAKPAAESNPYAYIPAFTDTDLISEDFLLTEAVTRQVWYDIQINNQNTTTGSEVQLMLELGPSDITTPAGQLIINQSIEGAKSKGLLGVLSLKMIGDNAIDLITVDDTDPQDIKSLVIDPVPSFKLHFDNQKTIWKFINKAAAEELETSSLKPLTLKGFIEIDPDTDITPPLPSDIEKYKFPNPTADIIKSVTDENTNITTTYSEIFI
ncbi:hypothetical protein [Aquimarina brevivitae]|uniref:Uncharacterized protein n=1 Tax=Aquimarina brevivitae TaxID=323412 RepID=A0A4Q7NZ34_9FLAO|nr:hypothetical protein [Aquimarina brevivitae]RZS92517.1 hypothetical protein EV197_2655 [Aquimarina brevivitae]